MGKHNPVRRVRRRLNSANWAAIITFLLIAGAVIATLGFTYFTARR